MEKYRHIEQFKLGFCDVDFKDEIKPSKVLALLEEVACESADELGFGYRHVKPKGYAFMVTEIRVRFIRPALLGEKVVLHTWPTPPSFVVFGREYEMYSEQGEKIAVATSKWCMIDFVGGKILSSKLLDDQDYSTYCTDIALDVGREKVPKIEKEEGICKFTITIANSEYDHNMHVNNTRYIDYAFNCFTVEELSEKKVEEFAVAYVKQCREGDTLSFYRKDEGKDSLVCGYNQKGELVVRTKIIFS